jgi:hypothetical protein
VSDSHADTARAFLEAVCAEVVGALVADLAEARRERDHLRMVADEKRNQRDDCIAACTRLRDEFRAAEESNARLTADRAELLPLLDNLTASMAAMNATLSMLTDLVRAALAAASPKEDK